MISVCLIIGFSLICNSVIWFIQVFSKKNKAVENKTSVLRNTVTALLSVFLSSFFPTIMLAIFRKSIGKNPGTTYGICVLYMAVAIIFVWFYREKVRKTIQFIAIAFILTIMMEFFVFNYNVTFYNWNLKTVTVNLNTAIKNNKISKITDNRVVVEKNGFVEFNDINVKTQNVYIRTEGNDEYVEGCVYAKDEGYAYDYERMTTISFNPGSYQGYNEIYAKAYSSGEIKSLKIDFPESKQEIVIKEVVLNKPILVKWNLFRMILLFFLAILFIIIKRYRLYKIVFDETNFRHRIFMSGTMGFCLVTAFLVCTGISTADKTSFISYPLHMSVSEYQPYIQQFDAYQKGQINLDLKPDKKMNQLDDVYDFSERSSENIGYSWDRAYYEGKYYSYFGIAPLLTIYYPVYFLTGELPSDLLVATVLCLFTIIFIFGAIRELAKTFLQRINLLLYGLVSIAATFGSMIYMVQSATNFYYIAIQSALAFLAGTVYFAFHAYRTKPGWKRIIRLFLTGLFFVFVVLSRPNVALLPLAFLTPIFIAILIDKNKKMANKICDSLCFLIPVFIGTAFIMYYNFIRFDSVTDFGAAYQLTVSDISDNHIRLDYFFDSIYAYFLQSPSTTFKFPWIILYTYDLSTTGRYLFYTINMGVLWIPLNLTPILFFKSISKSNKLKIITYLSVIVAVIMLAFIDFCLGGIHIRYACDISLALCLIGALILLETNPCTQDESAASKKIYRISVLICLVTIFMGTALIFVNENNFVMKNNPDYYIWLENLFRI